MLSKLKKAVLRRLLLFQKNIPQDVKCMNISDEYVKLTQEAMQKLVKPKKRKSC